MQRNLASGFDDSFKRHLAIEQRRAVLDTIARELGPDTTLGDIVDAASELGWSDIGELCLADLASALAGDSEPLPVTADASDTDDEAEEEDEAEDEEVDEDEEDEEEDEDDEEEDEDDDDDDEEEDDEDEEEEEAEEEQQPRKGRKDAAANRKPSSMDRALDRIDRALAARGRKPAAKPAKKKTSKKASKKLSKLADDDSEAMSLDQAAKLLIPLVRKLKEATMQDLEEQTGMGRRKLRFHIGQLVKHGRLKRHGMGRGTCYTVK